MSVSLIIFLHGVGARGESMKNLKELWQRRFPDSAFAMPDAPQPFDQGGAGRQWFSVSGVTSDNRADRVRNARAQFDQTLQALVTENGFLGRLDKVVLVGFSQGSIMALDAIASGRWSVAGVVAFSGRLATPTPLTPAKAARVCLINGAVDQIMPQAVASTAQRELSESGVDVQCTILEGLGHAISSDGIAIAESFIADIVGG